MNKYCTGCKTAKELSDFWKNKSTKDGLHDWCKLCLGKANKARLNGPMRDVELRQRMNRHLLRSYGITMDEYERLHVLQNGKCKICDGPSLKRKLAVDHCHSTGNIRGLLCENCNRGLGMFKDNVDTLSKAIQYLNESSK